MKNILVGIDASPRSRIALEQSLDLAANLGARVHLLAAVEPIGPAHRIELGVSDDPLAILDRNAAMMRDPDDAPAVPEDDDDAAAAILSCHKAQVPCTFRRMHGMAWRVIQEQSTAMDLVVLGRRGTIGRRPLGATAAAVLASPAAPALVCRDEVVPLRRVLLAYEPTPAGGRALRLAGELCSELNIELDMVVADPRRTVASHSREHAANVLRAYHVEGEQLQYPGHIEAAIRSTALELQSSLIIVPHHRTCLLCPSPAPAVRAALDSPTAMSLVVP